MRVISITGASGFIGQRLLSALGDHADLQIRVLVHRNKQPFSQGVDNRVLIEGDITRPETLEGFLEPGGVLVNLAYSSAVSGDENLAATRSLVEAGVKVGIKRLVHCSTAVVAGRVSVSAVNENTPCRPVNEYEFTKLAIEKTLQEKSAGKFELAILRPTAVFGPGGRNLLKLAGDLTAGSCTVNYLKSCLHGRRKMNLVCVENVIAALVFLINTDRPLNQEIFIVSDDESAANNYRDIEMRLMQCFGMSDYTLPPITLPDFVLSMLLRLAGRSNINPRRLYDGRRLSALGYLKPVTFEAGVTSFGDWYKSRCLINPEPGIR
jgi:nucleoside-diphosphate-sugar epimerase